MALHKSSRRIRNALGTDQRCVTCRPALSGCEMKSPAADAEDRWRGRLLARPYGDSRGRSHAGRLAPLSAPCGPVRRVGALGPHHARFGLRPRRNGCFAGVKAPSLGSVVRGDVQWPEPPSDPSPHNGEVSEDLDAPLDVAHFATSDVSRCGLPRMGAPSAWSALEDSSVGSCRAIWGYMPRPRSGSVCWLRCSVGSRSRAPRALGVCMSSACIACAWLVSMNCAARSIGRDSMRARSSRPTSAFCCHRCARAWARWAPLTVRREAASRRP